MVQLIMIILLLTALIGSSYLLMAHTLTIVEPIWAMLQKKSKTLKHTYNYLCTCMYMYDSVFVQITTVLVTTIHICITGVAS